MKAIVRDRYGSADVLSIEEVDKPVPKGDQVLVKVIAASINTADADLLRGRPRVARLGTGMSKPRARRLGLDMAGRVEAVGGSVSRFEPGDEVWADLFTSGLGAFAEYVCAAQGAFVPKPAGLTFEEAATLPHSGLLALQGLRRGGPISPGQRVVVNGAGGCVGPFAVQLARTWGAEVTAVDHTAKLGFLHSIGADHVIDGTMEDFTRNGERYDLILDIAATRSTLAFRRSLTDAGAYVLIARSLSGFFSAAVLGAGISMLGHKRMGVFNWMPNRSEDLAWLGRLVEEGKLAPILDHTCTLDEVPAAIRHLEAGHARGKIIVTP